MTDNRQHSVGVPWVAIQRNPRSGSGRARGELLRLVAALREHGIRPRMFANRDRFDAVIASAATPPQCVVAAGGDGTVGSVINRTRDIPVAILPLGTENLMARYLGIARDGAQLAHLIAEGRSWQMDTASLEQSNQTPRRFFLMAGFGLDGEIVHQTDAARTGTISKLSYVQPIVKSLRTYEYMSIRVFTDGDPQPLEGAFAIVVNLSAYAYGLKFATTARGDDGLLDVRVFEKGSRYQMLRYCYKVFRKQHETMPDVYGRRAKRVRVETERPVPAQVDGDPAGFTPVTITIDPAAVDFIVPNKFLARETNNA